MVSLRRKILFYFFLMAFFIITPLVSMYAAGYTLTSGLKIKKTGILTVKTDPKNALIYLNDVEQTNELSSFLKNEKQYLRTPLRLKNLTPGDYQVRIELENHWPWEKKLSINPGQSTFIEDVQLFKIAQPNQIIDSKIKSTAYSPDKSKAAFFNDNFLRIIDLVDYRTILKLSTATPATEIKWNSKNDKLIVGDQLIFTDIKKKPINLSISTSSSISLFEWADTGWLQEEISYCIDNECGLLNFNTGTKNTVATGTVKQILAENNHIHRLVEQKDTTELLTAKNGTDIMKIILPKSNYNISFKDENLTLYDNKFKTLYVIDSSSNITPIKETINNVKIFQSINKNRIIYANDFEIWLLDFSSNQRRLLTRQSEPVTGALWHESNNYIIFATQNSVKVLELDDREKYNILTLAQLENISDLAINKQNNTLFFTSSNQLNSLVLK